MPHPPLAQSFRDRKSAYTALDCWSSNGARAPVQQRRRARPYPQQQASYAQQPVVMQQLVAAPRAAPPLDEELAAWLQAGLAHARLA